MTTTKETRLLRCRECRHQWIRYRDGVPVQCPNCRSTYWNRKRKD